MAERISKSEQKRRFKRIEEGAAELAKLSDNDIKALPASEEVKAEILACRTVKTGALKRQIKYLAKILREEEAVDDVLAFLAEHKGSKVKQNRLQQEAERLRDLLVTEVLQYQEGLKQERRDLEMDWPAPALEEIADEHGMDVREVRRSLHQYARTRVQTQYREIFRLIKAALDREERLKKMA
jgi:ribosome-associated protein